MRIADRRMSSDGWVNVAITPANQRSLLQTVGGASSNAPAAVRDVTAGRRGQTSTSPGHDTGNITGDT